MKRTGIEGGALLEARLELTDAIYAASTDPLRWRDFMDRVTGWFGGNTAMYVRPRDNPLQTRFLGGNLDPGKVRDHDEYFVHCNPLIPRIGGTPPVTVRGELLIPLDEFKRTEFYNDWMAPMDCLHWIGVGPPTTGDRLVQIGVGRSPRYEPFSLDEERLLLSIAPHMARAVEISRRLDLLDSQASATASVLDTLGAGVLLVDAERRVVWSNAAAERLLAAGTGLTTAGGKLRASDPVAHQRLCAAIAEATRAAEGVRTGGATLAAPRAGDALPLSLHVSPLDERDRPGLGTGLLALVLASAPEMEAGFGEQGLRAVYDLTPAEARLAAALCAGQSLADHAESAGVSLNTVKYHLKSVFGKTGETRQPDLVRRLMADPVLRVAG